MRSFWKRAFLVLAIVFVAIQFFRPPRTNPASDPAAEIQRIVNLPPDVASILHRACGDCHSNDTQWPWYSAVAPTSWFVTGHVNEGRRHINFSAWVRPGKEPQDSVDRLKAISREVKEGGMPLTSYILVHWKAKLSPAEVSRICDWADQEALRLAANPAPVAASPHP